MRAYQQAKRFHCRCRECDARRVLRYSPNVVAQSDLPKCKTCGKRNWRLDRWMQERDTSKCVCTCGGSGVYVNKRKGSEFPHRRGSYYCLHRPNGEGRFPGDADYHAPGYDEYLAELATNEGMNHEIAWIALQDGAGDG